MLGLSATGLGNMAWVCLQLTHKRYRAFGDQIITSIRVLLNINILSVGCFRGFDLPSHSSHGFCTLLILLTPNPSEYLLLTVLLRLNNLELKA